MIQLNKCPSTLDLGYTAYSPRALRHLFDGKKVSHLLQFSRVSGFKDANVDLLKTTRTRISISGVQEKYSLKLEKRIFYPTEEHGNYILKPIPKDDLENLDFMPANEHLTMQIASQVYKLNVAKNGLIYFSDEEPAYITKRFDVREDGSKALKEDFASLLQKNYAQGNTFKYTGSYLDMVYAIDMHLGTATLAKESLFKLIVFNYLFSNGDAHLKNFSVIDYEQDGYYTLAPAYDLICTRLHIDDGDFALDNNLYDKDYEHPSFATFGFHAYDDFFDFGLKIGLMESRVKKALALFMSKTAMVEDFVARSFLSDELKIKYLHYYQDKLKRLNLSLSNKI